MPDVFGLVGAVTGVVGAITGTTGLIWSRRSIRASETSALAAEASAQEAARTGRLAADAQHEALWSSAPDSIVARVEGDQLVGEFAPPRDCRVIAFAMGAGGKRWHKINVPHVVHANQTVRLHIELWPEGKEVPDTENVLFQFWPPVEGDDATLWTCRCGGPTSQTEAGPGHWEWRVGLNSRRFRSSGSGS